MTTVAASENPRFTAATQGATPLRWRGTPAWARLPVLELHDEAAAAKGDGPPHGAPGPSRWDNVVVVAAHPDDETLGAGGLISALRAPECRTRVQGLILTRGEASHPGSTTHSEEDLAAIRIAESAAAWHSVGGHPDDLTVLALPDGCLADHLMEATRAIVERAGQGTRTLIVSPYADDGHPDHEAAATAAARAAARTDATLLEYPIWWWQHAAPEDGFPPGFHKLTLTHQDLARKIQAVHCHTSQITPLSPARGDETLLGSHVLAHALSDEEVFRLTPPGLAHDDELDLLHQRRSDPWRASDSWYEARKRTIVTALLPRRHYVHAVEVGCSTGHLAAALAPRCGALSLIDSSAHALDAVPGVLDRAPERVDGEVDLLHGRVPQTWPRARVDLVVLSEVGYFLSPAELEGVLEKMATSWLPAADLDRTVVAAHWRHPVDGWPLDGPAVHRILEASPLMPPLVCRYIDGDVEMLVFADRHPSPDPA